MRTGFFFGLVLLGSPAFSDTANLDGPWILDEIRSTGISSDRAWDRAQKLKGQSVSIEDYTLFLSEGTRCSMSQPKPETLRNDMRTFGSFGGNWQQVGLVGDSHQFHVIVTNVTCEDTNERLFRIISQPDQNFHLADFGRVFWVMKRQEKIQ